MTSKDNQAQLVELPTLSPTANSSGGVNLIEAHLDLIRSVKVKVTAVLGSAEMSVGELSALKDGSQIKLDRAAGAAVDILLEGQVVARGQLVAVDDNFGVRITEVTTPSKK